MAKFLGNDGAVTIPGATVFFDEFNLNAEVDVHPVTDFVDAAAGWETILGGLKRWKVAVNGFVDDANIPAVPDGTSGGTTLQFKSGTTKTGNVIISDWSIGEKVGDVVKVSFNMRGNGALS